MKNIGTFKGYPLSISIDTTGGKHTEDEIIDDFIAMVWREIANK